ncbi:MAG: bifunctional tRNA (5-methylaminomethyl-2-thiouridine)(34)-methyltransferase MnmD/FAD-dependent 5-carboxymethylaminomethyl-2-thiouridine(34) oxidoreductase MnmC [Rubrivivax sp.]|nr:bifunctional tRNA (5-methylaminomethyl-2-thiouridine)(34)-methyltransferase MnmD/FAD-dependent 5-carboxymethylaminomethyl-2-thiouridine(34) oxidoreductase MnmC [Rubrivivax sp.]
MKSRPIVPARIEWADDGTPCAPDFGDVYHARVGARVQARHVFLAGNGLPARWAGRRDFTIAETGFGLGHNFLATWQAWRDDPARPQRLHLVSIEAHPPRRDDLQRAHAGSDSPDLAAQLVAAWPPLVPGLHRLDFEGGALRLLLALGDVRDLLPELVFAADAFYLDGFAPALNPAMWDPRMLKALGRRAAPDATAATWSVARSLRDGLAAAGFDWQRAPGLGGKRETLRARHAPRHRHAHAANVPADDDRRAVVVGAGLAGACTAAALAALGFEVTVLDRHDQPAGGSSGNPAGLFHATVHADDGPHARLFRAAALHTARLLDGLDPGRVPQGRSGLLRLEQALDVAAMRARVDRLGLPAEFLQALEAAEASRRAGAPLAASAWFYPGGGWASPGALVRERLAHPGIRFVGSCNVQALQRAGGHWQLLGTDGAVLASAPQLVLAVAGQVNPLLASIGAAPFALTRSRGQVSHFDPDADAATALRCAVAGDGYALPLPGGGLLCGATTAADDDDAALRDADHRANFERLQRLCGLQAPADPARWQGRVGWRVQPADRLPLAGPLPALRIAAGTRLDQARLLPREPGLHLACGFGARGITLAPLLGELVAARIAGTPLPLEQSLVDAVDPGRFLVRAARNAVRSPAA